MNPGIICTLLVFLPYFFAGIINLLGRLQPRLKLMNKGSLSLDAVDGTKTILSCAGTPKFCSLREFGSYFSNLNEAPIATPATPIRVYQPIFATTVLEMFSAVPGDLDRLCLTQHQIVNLVDKYSHLEWLWENVDNVFFLVKEGHTFFVVSLYEHRCWLYPNVRHLIRPHGLRREGETITLPHRIRIVVPKPLDKISRGFFFCSGQ